MMKGRKPIPSFKLGIFQQTSIIHLIYYSYNPFAGKNFSQANKLK